MSTKSRQSNNRSRHGSGRAVGNLAHFACVLLLSAGPFTALAAKDPEPGSFRQAQELAWSGKREEARTVCREVLENDPEHHDARILLARTAAWDRDFATARQELARVLDSRPDYVDASRALADVELWDGRPAVALEVTENGLRNNPDDDELLYRKARAFEKLDRAAEARWIADYLADQYPAEARYALYSEKLRIRNRTEKMSMGYRYEDFSEFSDPWQEWQLALKTSRNWGSLIGRVRHAERFDDAGNQYEIDAYPRLPRKMYFYLNGGYSSSDPFPNLRLGAELYKNFKHGWEASVGGRYLSFDSSDVLIYTGSVGKYYGNYWFSLRPTATAREGGASISLAARIRRYFGSTESFLGMTVSQGSKPDTELFSNDEDRLTSGRVTFEAQKVLGELWAISGSVGYRTQEFRVDQDRKSVVGSVGVSRVF